MSRYMKAEADLTILEQWNNENILFIYWLKKGVEDG